MLGMPGLTAYFGLLDIGQPKDGRDRRRFRRGRRRGLDRRPDRQDQGLPRRGHRRHATTRCGYLIDELGFDAAFNYKTTKNYVERLKELCPKGIDVYFDNVGGAITDAVIPLLNVEARMSICGQISQYNLEKPETGPRWLWALIVKQARVEGFLVFQFADKFQQAAWKWPAGSRKAN